MSPFWKNLFQNLKTGIAVSSEKIEEYSHIGKLKFDISIVKRNLDRTFCELGRLVVRIIEADKNKNIVKNNEVLSYMEKIKELEQKVSELEDKLKKTNMNSEQKEQAKE